ncbi:MAG: HlyD family type I secretion periplasmic adaptor subunit [Pseudomonadota bacterium]
MKNLVLKTASDRSDRRPEPHIAAFLAAVFACSVLGFFVLAAMTSVHEVVRAEGTLTPVGNYTRIETLEGGIVERVHAQDGDLVAAGDLLIELRNPDLQRDLSVTLNEVEGLERRLRNAEAILEVLRLNQPLDHEAFERLRAQGLRTAAATLQVYFESQANRDTYIQQRRQSLQIISGAEAFARDRVVRQEVRLEEQANMYERGLIVRSAFQNELNQTDSMRAAASEAAVRLVEAQEALAIARAERQQERLTLLETTIEDLTEAERALASAQEARSVLEYRGDGLRIVAPEAGVIQAIAFTHTGEVVDQGETLYELLPASNQIIAEVLVSSADVGYVFVSQPVSVSIDTFDVRQFGRVDGTILSVSPVPIIDEQTGQTDFRVLVQLDRLAVGSVDEIRQLQAGMTVVAEISTGERTLLEYFLKPIFTTLEVGFSER